MSVQVIEIMFLKVDLKLGFRLKRIKQSQVKAYIKLIFVKTKEGKRDNINLITKKEVSNNLSSLLNANLLSFRNPKMFVRQQKQRHNCQVCYK